MESRIDILNELKTLSPLLAGMEKLNVFTVPEGYFNCLVDDVLACLREEEKSLKTDSPFHSSMDLPAGYFDGLADSILARIKAQQNESAAAELRSLSPMLYSIQNENVFTVPAGYFDGLDDTILANIKAQQNESAAAELRSLSPLLYSIQNENVFTVPTGYFETLANTLITAVQPRVAKVVVMRKRSFSFMKYAVAAAFTGMMALGVFKFTNSGTDSNSKLDAVVLNGLQINKDKTFDQEFAKVSDEDIIKYLQVNGENVDAQTVANQTLDEKELPAQADYLMDDKALDKYLDNINTADLKN